MNPKNTLVMVRGLNAKDGCASWWIMARTLEHVGFKLINSVKCNEVCNNKWYNQMMFQRYDINTPETYLIRHSEGATAAAEKLNNKLLSYEKDELPSFDEIYELLKVL